jgi:hypothetical protein
MTIMSNLLGVRGDSEDVVAVAPAVAGSAIDLGNAAEVSQRRNDKRLVGTAQK